MRVLRIEHQGRTHFATAHDEDDQLSLLGAAPWRGGTPTGETLAMSEVRLLAPVVPSKIACVGRNYAAHAKELGNELPKEPLLFLKPPSAVCASGDEIVLPAMSERVEHEAEIGVVIGTRLKSVTPSEARRGIYAITCVNDVTARDLQKKDVQFTRAKGFDGFCPVGPWLETEFDLESIAVTGRVNGAVRQHGHTRDMAFPIAELVSFISRVMTLEPGDLISTGTPEGVGPLLSGDVVEIEVSRVGVLRNTVR
jgi:2-keto-4-pentenoate hydratase/2-oxohepta-3-ene-1,7-dioic acid hydratase in catechol pathway